MLIAIGGFTAILIILLASFIGSVYSGAFGKIYSEDELKSFENQFGSVILSADSATLGYVFNINRTEAEFEEMPPSIINALLATEDVRFFEHDGIDSRSLLRVLIRTIIMGDRSGGGGSTLTQQLAKNMYGRQNHGFLSIPVNKLKEMILARRLESVFTKEEILTKYLNTMSFGEDTYGIAAAARRFFNKSLDALQIDEAALLIGMLKAPTTYNPRLHPENALARRNVVLSQMEKYDFLDAESADSLRKKPLQLNYYRQSDQGNAGYFVAMVKRKARTILSEVPKDGDAKRRWSLEEDGLIIETTLNYLLQSYAVKAMQQHLQTMQPLLNQQYNHGGYQQKIDSLVQRQLSQLNLKSDTARFRNLFSWETPGEMTAADSIRQVLLQLHSGTIALNPQTGELLTYVGGIDFATNPYDQIQAKRQLASAFKPVLYTAALSSGKSPCDYIDNQPFTLTDYDDWQPANYNEQSGGKYSLAASLAFSKNIPSVRLLFETGFEKVKEIWQSLGFSNTFEENPSIALGTLEASLYEVATGYSALANGGFLPTPYMIKSIKTRDGRTIYNHKSVAAQQVLNPSVANQLTAILQKAVNEGTGVSMRSRFGVDIPLAGKTGTSQNFADAWFIGYNPGIIIASRVGASMPIIHFSSGQYGSGSRLALPLVGLTLAHAEKNPETLELISGHFSDEASPELWITCEDYREATGLEKFINVFKNETTTLKKEQQRAKRKGFFKRLFNKKDE